MSKLEFFVVLFPVGNLNNILIPDTSSFLKGTLDLCELMRWVGFWLYIWLVGLGYLKGVTGGQLHHQ